MSDPRKDSAKFWEPVHQVRGQVKEDVEQVDNQVVQRRKLEGLPDLTKGQAAWLGDFTVIVLLGYVLLQTTEVKKLLKDGAKTIDELIPEMREARAKANTDLDKDDLWIAEAVEDTVELMFRIGQEAEKLVA